MSSSNVGDINAEFWIYLWKSTIDLISSGCHIYSLSDIEFWEFYFGFSRELRKKFWNFNFFDAFLDFFIINGWVDSEFFESRAGILGFILCGDLLWIYPIGKT